MKSRTGKAKRLPSRLGMPLKLKASPDPDLSLREQRGSESRLLVNEAENNPTMSFDFAVETTEVSTTTTEDAEDTEETPEFVSSEVPEIYLSLGDWKALLGEMLEALDLEALKIYSDDTLEDASRLLGEYDEAHPMQQLHMVASLAKSTAGKMQRDTGHGIGLSDGKVPESHFEESFSYALYYSDLPSISWDGLDGGERESLEELGIDPSEIGFDTTYGGPKLLVIDGQRLPIAVEEGNEVLEALEILQQVPDEPSHWTEDGFVESSHPEVFGEETDKVAGRDSEADSGSDDEVFNLAANPERVNEVNVSDLRGQGPEELSVTNITNLRAIQTMLRVESDADNTRKGAMTRLKERRNALQNGDGDDGIDTEEAGGASDDEAEEAVDSVEEDELTEADKNLMATLVQSGQAEDLEDAKEQLQSL